VHNLLVREELGEPEHVVQVAPVEAAPVLGAQLDSHRRDDLLTVLGPLLTEQVGPDPPADHPVKEHELAVDRDGRAPTALLDDLSEVAEQGSAGLHEGHVLLNCSATRQKVVELWNSLE
jgi:hypothetical protein